MNAESPIALISVTDKTGLDFLAPFLKRHKIQILSTGGTAEAIRKSGMEVLEVSEYTGFPELLDGRLKTIHPKIAGGLLFQRRNPEHVKQAKDHHINPIDFLIVNLYAFKKTTEKPGVSFDEVIENIDVGGPNLIRAAAKNHESVTVIVDPLDYQFLMKELEKNDGTTSLGFRLLCAEKAFELTNRYDHDIWQYIQIQRLRRAYTRPDPL